MMTPAMPSALFPELQAVCTAQGFPLRDPQLEYFAKFKHALYAWNAHKNLTRIPEEECEVRHFAESCLILEWVGSGRILDIGSGPGLPAWPIARVAEQSSVVAIDSNGKMLEFLRSEPLHNLEAILGRVEDMGSSEEFDVVTGRALAPLAIQLEVSAQACKIGGRVIPFRTERDELELEATAELGLELQKVVTKTLSDGIVRVFPIYVKIKPTPGQYPRPWTMIKKAPLT